MVLTVGVGVKVKVRVKVRVSPTSNRKKDVWCELNFLLRDSILFISDERISLIKGRRNIERVYHENS